MILFKTLHSVLPLENRNKIQHSCNKQDGDNGTKLLLFLLINPKIIKRKMYFETILLKNFVGFQILFIPKEKEISYHSNKKHRL